MGRFQRGLLTRLIRHHSRILLPGQREGDPQGSPVAPHDPRLSHRLAGLGWASGLRMPRSLPTHFPASTLTKVPVELWPSLHERCD